MGCGQGLAGLALGLLRARVCLTRQWLGLELVCARTSICLPGQGLLRAWVRLARQGLALGLLCTRVCLTGQRLGLLRARVCLTWQWLRLPSSAGLSRSGWLTLCAHHAPRIAGPQCSRPHWIVPLSHRSRRQRCSGSACWPVPLSHYSRRQRCSCGPRLGVPLTSCLRVPLCSCLRHHPWLLRCTPTRDPGGPLGRGRATRRGCGC